MIEVAKNRRRGLMYHLVAASIITAIVMGVARFLQSNPGAGVEPVSQQIGALVSFLFIFALGGVPAVVTTLALARRKPNRTTQLSAYIALVGNLPSMILGFGVLRILIWETTIWILFSFSAFLLGSLVFFACLRRDDKIDGDSRNSR